MKKSSSGQMWIYREFRRVETERETVGEWTSEGGFERENDQVEADGTPPVIHRGTYDGTCSEWIFPREYQFGWYRRSICFCPMDGAKAFFIFRPMLDCPLLTADCPG